VVWWESDTKSPNHQKEWEPLSPKRKTGSRFLTHSNISCSLREFGLIVYANLEKHHFQKAAEQQEKTHSDRCCFQKFFLGVKLYAGLLIFHF
jgi:hypothetical protein